MENWAKQEKLGKIRQNRTKLAKIREKLKDKEDMGTKNNKARKQEADEEIFLGANGETTKKTKKNKRQK